jgi:hypothetical protein
VYFQIVTTSSSTGNVRYQHRLNEITPDRVEGLLLEFLNEAIPPLDGFR